MTSPFPFAVREHNLPAAHIREYARATSNSQDEELRLHVRQYTPVDNPEPQKGDITIIGAHANGFPKVLEDNRIPYWFGTEREGGREGCGECQYEYETHELTMLGAV